MGFWSYLFPGDEGELADLFWSNQQTSSGITLKNQFYEGTPGDDRVSFAQLSLAFNPYQSTVSLYEGNDSIRTVGTSSGTKFYLGVGNDLFTALDGLRYSRIEGGAGEDTIWIKESLWDRQGLFHTVISTDSGNDYILVEKEDRLTDSIAGIFGGAIFMGEGDDRLIIRGNGLVSQSSGSFLTYEDGSKILDGIINLGEGNDYLKIEGFDALSSSPYLVDTEIDLGGNDDIIDLRYLNFASATRVRITGGDGHDVAILPFDISSPPTWLQEFESFVYSPNNGNGTPGAITGSGAFREGVTLIAPVVTGDPDGMPTNPNYKYQWYKGGNIVVGATASSYAVSASGAGTYKVAVTYTDARGFIATLDSPEQVVIKPIPQQVDIAPSQRGSRFRVESDAAPEVIVNLKGSPDLIEINAEVSATLNAVTTENWGTGYVAWNVGGTIQAGTGERVSLNGLGKYSFVATAINEATSTIVLEQGKNSAFFLHDAYSAFYEGLTLSTDSTGRQSAARILDFDVIKMGSAGGNSIVDLTSKDYITGAVTVHGADKGRSIFWGTDSDDTFLSGGGDSVIFGGGGFNQSILGAGKDVLQFRSTVDSTNLIQGFDPTKDVLELWRGRTETVEAPTFITEGNSATMTWGSNTVQFEGLTGITAESLLISTQFAA